MAITLATDVTALVFTNGQQSGVTLVVRVTSVMVLEKTLGDCI